MIVNEDGRAKSFRTHEEIEALLQSELESFTPEERETLEILLEELKNGTVDDEPGIFDMIAKAEYKHPPVDMKTFVLDEFYLGNTCDNIYPVLLDDLVELFNGGYHEAILTGSIGWGKTFFASIGLCRIIYELSCMKDPHKSFGLAKDSNISIVNLSVNETLAMKVVFENVATKVKASPYFQEHFPFDATKKELRFPGNIWVAARSSTDSSVLGLNIISGMVDETNFMRKTQPQKASHARWGHYDHAETLYNAIQRRMKSRFQRQGRIPGKLFVVSSKQTVDDFTATRIRAAKDDPEVFVRDYPLWGVKPPEYYSDETFWVVVGNEQIPSKIIEDDEELVRLQTHTPDGVVLIEVPEDFRLDFESDLEGAIRDIAGVATVAISPFIQRREKILEAQDTREHPFTSDVYTPGQSSGGFMWDRMVKMVKEMNFGVESERLRPIINPAQTRHIHIDPSLNGDCTGFCMSHIAGWKDVVRRADDGRQYTERAPVYIVDVILRIDPPLGGEIIFGDVRRLVYELASHGYLITSISYDSWQSVDAIQQLIQKGYNAQSLSVDTSPEPYDTVKSALYENRIFFYEYPPLVKELQQLEEHRMGRGRKRKIDHPVRGSKDCADALAGTIYTLSKMEISQPLPIIKSQPTGLGETWMEEPRQTTSPNGLDQKQMDQFGTMPPFITSSSSWGGDDWGGGWNPNGL